MKRLLAVFLSIPLVILLVTACDRGAAPEVAVYHHSIFSFGTIIDVSIADTDEATAEQAFEQLEADFRYMHNTWHPWQRSALNRDNYLFATTEWFSDAPSVRPLLEIARDLAIKSDHLFNPAIGKLIRLWGLKDGEHATGFPPDEADIRALVTANPRMDDIEMRGIQIRSRNPDVVVDLGGFAKGYGINQAIETLQIMGIKNAVINAGGDLKAIGRHGDRPWRIGIRHPRKEDAVLAYVDVSGSESVFTSGDYERYFEYDNKRYHHIIDPRTGYPATGAQSVTVIHEDAALADAAATALFVAGAGDWQRIARAMGVRHVLLVDAQGNVHMSHAMQQRVHFIDKPAKMTVTDE